MNRRVLRNKTLERKPLPGNVRAIAYRCGVTGKFLTAGRDWRRVPSRIVKKWEQSKKEKRRIVIWPMLSPGGQQALIERNKLRLFKAAGRTLTDSILAEARRTNNKPTVCTWSDRMNIGNKWVDLMPGVKRIVEAMFPNTSHGISPQAKREFFGQ